jgi:hypothetical protein
VPKPDKDDPPGIPGYDEEFDELRSAKAWGLTPKEWRAESLDDRALMQSFVLFEATIEAYRQEWRDKQRLKEEDRADRDENTFRKLKNRLKEHEQ